MSYSGYGVNMRRDKRTGEDLAVIPRSYDSGRGRYYMALTLMDGWVELDPEYVTSCTKTVSDYSQDLKSAIDRSTGYILHIEPRLKG